MSFAPTNRHPTEALPSPHHLVATPSISWVVPQHWGPASQWGVNQVHTWFTNVEGGAFQDMYSCLGTPTGADITSLTEEQCVACCGEEGRDLYEAWQQALPSFDPMGNACVGGGWDVHGVPRACMPCTPITHPRSPLRPLTHSSFLPLIHLFMLSPSCLVHCTSQLAALSAMLAHDPGSRPGAPSHEWCTAVPCHMLKHERYTHSPCHHAVSSCKLSLLHLLPLAAVLLRPTRQSSWRCCLWNAYHCGGAAVVWGRLSRRHARPLHHCCGPICRHHRSPCCPAAPCSPLEVAGWLTRSVACL